MNQRNASLGPVILKNAIYSVGVSSAPGRYKTNFQQVLPKENVVVPSTPRRDPPAFGIPAEKLGAASKQVVVFNNIAVFEKPKQNLEFRIL